MSNFGVSGAVLGKPSNVRAGKMLSLDQSVEIRKAAAWVIA